MSQTGPEFPAQDEPRGRPTQEEAPGGYSQPEFGQLGSYTPPATGGYATPPSPPAAVQGGGYPALQYGAVDLYSPAIDPNQVLAPEQRAAYMQHRLQPGLAPWLVVVLSIFTFGIFGVIYLQIKQGQLPVVKADDPSTGRAIGFMFIPFFNLYWYFIVWPRLVDRINFQYRLRGQLPPINRGIVIPSLILALAGAFFIITLPVAWVMFCVSASQIQAAANGLAGQESQVGTAGLPAASY